MGLFQAHLRLFARVPGAMQRVALAKRCFAEPGPYRTPAPRLCSAPGREERPAALRPGHETALEPKGLFGEIAPATGPEAMSAQTSPTAARTIYWPSVITVISAAILIG